MQYKRFQYWGRNADGKVEKLWSEWYEYESDFKPKYQLGKALLNEYKEN